MSADLLLKSPSLRHMAALATRRLAPMIQVCARIWRVTLARRVCIVTVIGSYGKTTTTRALSLGLTGAISKWIENNAGAWPALRLLSTAPTTPVLVLEVGIGGPGKMRPQARTLHPDVVVVTSIGSEHNTSFKTIEATCREKGLMVEALTSHGIAVLNADDPNVLAMRSRNKGRTVTFGRSAGAEVRALETELDWPRGTRGLIEIAGHRRHVKTPLLGEESFNAVLATFAVAHALGADIERIAARLEELEPSRARLQPVALPHGRWLIRDEEKSSLETIDVALDLLARVPAARKICVLGGVSEPVGPQGDLYRRLGGRVAAAADIAIFLGTSQMRKRYRRGALAGGMSEDSIFCFGSDVDSATSLLNDISRPEDVILVKGRDSQKLDRISLALMGRPVRCSVETCLLQAMSCHFCTHLETGWPGNPARVP